ncbi:MULTISPECIES: hypothetical protein [unclassified Micromonospora]|uniref:hypothetical protein n=1 Tax=unclassified Micromonospora TaxID=2617518 RepID=UPI002FF35FC9
MTGSGTMVVTSIGLAAVTLGVLLIAGLVLAAAHGDTPDHHLRSLPSVTIATHA